LRFIAAIESVSIGVHPWLKFFAPPRLCVEKIGRRRWRFTFAGGNRSGPGRFPGGRAVRNGWDWRSPRRAPYPRSSASIFFRVASSILINGGTATLVAFARQFLRRVNAEPAAIGDFARGVISLLGLD